MITPWSHMCEGLEKSNQKANKAFQSKTMSDGGEQSTQDPVFRASIFLAQAVQETIP